MTNIDYEGTTPDVSFTYNRMGQQATITDGTGTRTFTYNDSLQLAAETNAMAVISRSYDSLGRPAGFDLSSGGTAATLSVAYGYDNLGRFGSVSSSVDSVSSVVNYSYLEDSDLLSGYTLTSSPLALSVVRSYEPNRNLITSIQNNVGATSVSRFDYINDEIGRRTSMAQSGSAFEGLDAFWKYGYNSRSEVTSGKRYFGTNVNQTNNPVGLQDYAYAYDNIGNRVTGGTAASPSAYEANELNQYEQRTVPGIIDVIGSSTTGATITVNNSSVTRQGAYWYKELAVANIDEAIYQELRITGVKKNAGSNGMDIVSSETGHVFVAETPELFAYDDDGNLTSDGRFVYSWDAENRLVSVSSAVSVVSFSYDYMSRRYQKVVNGTATNTFVYDGWNLLEEQSLRSLGEGGSTTNYYVWGLDLSGSLQGAGGIGGLLSVVKATGDLSPIAYFATGDANGNIADYVDGSGAVVAHREFDPYGNTVVAVGSMVNDFHFWFSTKYLDQESGLYYYGLRFYKPEIGRWASRDPIEEAGGKSLYAFAANAPIDYVDSLGEQAQRGFWLYEWPMLALDGSTTAHFPTVDMTVDSDSACAAAGQCSHLTFNGVDMQVDVLWGLTRAHEQRHIDDYRAIAYDGIVAYARGKAGCHKSDAASQCWKEAVDIARYAFYYAAAYQTTMNVDVDGRAWVWRIDWNGYRTTAEQALKSFNESFDLTIAKEAECQGLDR